MFFISKKKFREFNKEIEKDFETRYIYYLFDNYPLLKINLNFDKLSDIYKVKKIKYLHRVFLMMEAEVVFGEFFLEDSYFESLISKIMELDCFEQELDTLILRYKEEVIGDKQSKIINFFTKKNIFDFNECIQRKFEFLEYSENFTIDKYSFIWGIDFKDNIYFSNLEFD